ncbi:MAG TPA: hypothetical protein VGI45_05535 [Terracidiphilus sp.]
MTGVANPSTGVLTLLHTSNRERRHGPSTGIETRFVNTSVVDEAYRLVHEPQVLEIEI